MSVSLSPLQEGYITAEAQRSQRKFYCLAQTFASLRIELRCVFGVLWALSVSAVRFCGEVCHKSTGISTLRSAPALG